MAHLVLPLFMPSVSPPPTLACLPHHPTVCSHLTRDLGLPPAPRPHPYPPPVPQTSRLCSTLLLAPHIPHSRLPYWSPASPVDTQLLLCPLQAQGGHVSAPGCPTFLPGRDRRLLDFLGACVPPRGGPWIYAQLPPPCFPAPRTTLPSLVHLAHTLRLPPAPESSRFN